MRQIEQALQQQLGLPALAPVPQQTAGPAFEQVLQSALSPSNPDEPEELNSLDLPDSPDLRGNAAPYANLINQQANRFGVDADLVQSVVRAESGFNPQAVSKSGAQGLMQLMPATAKGLGVTNPFDPAQNIAGGTQYLSQLLKRFEGNKTLAVAAYNAGPNAVSRYGGVPPFAETQNYVQKVLGDRK